MRHHGKLSIPVLTAITASFAVMAAAFATNPCDALYQAGIKTFQTPHRVYSTTTMRGGKPQTGEAVLAGGVEYVQLHGKWMRSPSTPQEMIEEAQGKLKTHPDTCTSVSDQVISGQAVSVYKAHNSESGANQVVRILKSSGLMQGGTVILPDDGITVETRYEYDNVRAPAGVQ